ncbi:MAG: hypothetical protein LBD51_01755, partial [Bifidobacteriaceae bacterium]|nr:hypothetical protein [Bifidobacteriaceae bacterium]
MASPIRIAVVPGASPFLLLSGASLAQADQALPEAESLPVGDGIGLVLCGVAGQAPPGTRWEPARSALGRLNAAQQAV